MVIVEWLISNERIKILYRVYNICFIVMLEDVFQFTIQHKQQGWYSIYSYIIAKPHVMMCFKYNYCIYIIYITRFVRYQKCQFNQTFHNIPYIVLVIYNIITVCSTVHVIQMKFFFWFTWKKNISNFPKGSESLLKKTSKVHVDKKYTWLNCLF